jgi:hypothetical protein
MTTTYDGPLLLARRRLDDAISALADPTPVAVDGCYRWVDPVYVRVRGALRGQAIRRHTTVNRSMLPCRADVLTWLIDVDNTVARWEPDAKTTIERLHRLAARTFRPQDCWLIDGYSRLLEWWVLSAGELLAEHPTVSLELPCPRCGASIVYRRNSSGEAVRVWALRVSGEGCVCVKCRAWWSPDQFDWLAKLLGCQALPA